MQFFRFFPTTPYIFTDGLHERALTITNPTAALTVVQRVQEHRQAFYDYVVRDGERPDTVALRVYGDVIYTWLILLTNNIYTLYDWPLSQREFENYIQSAYGSITAAQTQWIQRTVEGWLVDDITFATLPPERRGTPISQYDIEQEKNEARRRIKIIPKEFAIPLHSELRQLFT